MLDNRRSEIEIIGAILGLSHKGARKTEILYQGNLSYMQLQNYLSVLLEKNVLEEKSVRTENGNYYTIYQTTDKGKDLLADIHKTLTYFK